MDRFGRSVRFLVLAAFFAAVTASAQVRGRIEKPGASRLQIAVAPLADLGGGADLGGRFATTLSRNLALSGYFRVLDADAHIEGPNPFALSEINFANWAVLGAQALVKGTVQRVEEDVEVVAYLFDVVQRSQIGGQRIRARASDVDRTARRMADEILRYLTGERGPFESEIAFVSRRGGRSKEIFVMSVDGLDSRRLTSNGTINLAPSWRPDTSSLLFTSYQDRRPRLYALDLRSMGQRRLTASGGLNLGAEWSPDGSSIAISLEDDGNSDIVLLNADGSLQKRLTHSSAIEVSPTWSPDGKQIAFVSNRSGGPQIYVMNRDGSDQRRLTFEGNYNTSPAWSPKGDRVAYVGRDRRFDIYTIDVKAGGVRQITSGQGSNEDPSFSPDGRYLVFSSTRNGSPTIVLSDLAGGHQIQLTDSGGDDSSPAWSPRLP